MEPNTRQLHPKARPLAAAVLVAAVLTALGGCGTDSGARPDNAPTADPSAASSSAAASPGIGATPADPATGPEGNMATDEYTTQLLLLHEQLKTQLGPAYSDAWVDGGVLHVAVTDSAAEATVRDAGAVPVLVGFNSTELQQAKAQVRTWLAQQPLPALEVHSIAASGRDGAVIVEVPADQVAALQSAAADQAPAGEIPVIVKESPGMATPYSTK
ncbi:hypothetical protein LJ756_07195 [Arthrobacter sp. zg-Y411]|uniref:hypothetical protein n=1 Tax=Arthrobacter TaxID=1663 RepID=UPI001D14D056|nr:MULTISPECIES: hypothetical protein [Arthrobacter]MCC3294408.1 hypothetical protein [Arthrobacter zhangbolii]MDN3903170.1 hypothetical protein [Arthrobacter sp. YD2]